MPKLTQIASVAGNILGGLVALYTVVKGLEPGTKVAVAAEISKVDAEVATVGTDIMAFRNAGWLGKGTAAISLIGTLDGVIDVAKEVWTDGANIFKQDWPMLQGAVNQIIHPTATPIKPSQAGPMISVSAAATLPSSTATAGVAS